MLSRRYGTYLRRAEAFCQRDLSKLSRAVEVVGADEVIAKTRSTSSVSSPNTAASERLHRLEEVCSDETKKRRARKAGLNKVCLTLKREHDIYISKRKGRRYFMAWPRQTPYVDVFLEHFAKQVFDLIEKDPVLTTLWRQLMMADCGESDSSSPNGQSSARKTDCGQHIFGFINDVLNTARASVTFGSNKHKALERLNDSMADIAWQYGYMMHKP